MEEIEFKFTQFNETRGLVTNIHRKYSALPNAYFRRSGANLKFWRSCFFEKSLTILYKYIPLIFRTSYSRHVCYCTVCNTDSIFSSVPLYLLIKFVMTSACLIASSCLNDILVGFSVTIPCNNFWYLNMALYFRTWLAASLRSGLEVAKWKIVSHEKNINYSSTWTSRI